MVKVLDKAFEIIDYKVEFDVNFTWVTFVYRNELKEGD